MKSYKRILLVLLVALCGMGAANAQIIRFGVKAGLNLNSLHFSDFERNISDDNKCGYTLGVMTELNVPIVGLCFDLSAMYTRMNARPVEGTNEGRIGRDFLEIPLNIKYKFGLPVVGRILSPYLLTGPAAAIRLSKNPTTDGSVQTKGAQWAWNVGLGVEIMHHLQIQGSYGFGMNNVVNKVVGWDTNNDVKIKNNYWTVTAAWLF